MVQLCALLMGWLAIEDGGMRKFIDEKVGLDEIRETIQGIPQLSMNLTVEQLNNVEDVEENIGDENIEEERANAKEEKEIMEVLIDILGDGSINGKGKS